MSAQTAPLNPTHPFPTSNANVNPSPFPPSSPTTTIHTTGGSVSRRGRGGMNRYSVNAVFSMAAEQDVEVEDELARSEF